MPNHVKTVVKIKDIKNKSDVDMILDMITVTLDDGVRQIDFNKIIPEPQEESECPEDCKVNKDSHISIYEKKPWFDWYEWHEKYWDTKWNAYDGYTDVGESYIQLVFSTAWSVARPVIKKLELLGYNIDVKYADEDWGSNCGEMHYDVNSGWIECPPKGNSHAFAKRLWNRY